MQLSDSETGESGVYKHCSTVSVATVNSPSDDERLSTRLHNGSGLVSPKMDGTGPSSGGVQVNLLKGSFIISHLALICLGWGDMMAGAHILGATLRRIVPLEGETPSQELVVATLDPSDYVVHPHHVTAIGNGDNHRGAELLTNIVAQLLKQAAHERAMSTGVH